VERRVGLIEISRRVPGLYDNVVASVIDGTLVATSSNANLQHEIANAPNGTHILTIQGLDDQGTAYFLQQNININVTE